MTVWDYLSQNPGWGLIYLLAGTISLGLLISGTTMGIQKIVVAARISTDQLLDSDDD